MSNSHAYIDKSALTDWKSRMASINEEAISILNEYQTKVNQLNDYMKGNVAEGFVNDETNTIKENLAFHNNMKDLEKLIDMVIEKMSSF